MEVVNKMDFKIKSGKKLPSEIVIDRFIHPQDKSKFSGFEIDGFRIPGIIDMHIHGSFGWDFSLGDYEKTNELLDNLLSIGLTGIVPTIITCDENQRIESLRVLKKIFIERKKPPFLHGIHMEGPYLSQKKRGAHDKNLLRHPSIEEFQNWQKESGNNIKIITIAPELPGAIKFIEKISKTGVICSLGHTNASSEETIRAINAGAKSITHLFNAMPKLHHRNPNILSTVLANQKISVEIIADGRHISPDIIKFASNLYENEKIILISDSIAPAGNPDGEYNFYGATIEKKDGICYSNDGIIFGGGMTLIQSIKELTDKAYLQWGFIGTSVWRSPCLLLGIEPPDAEVLLDEKLNWIATRDKTTWYWKQK